MPRRPKAPPERRDRFAYRGYFIIQTQPGWGDQVSISKDGHHIGYAESEHRAKHIVDELLGPPAGNTRKNPSGPFERAKQELRATGVTLRKIDDEYQVKLASTRQWNDASVYFTNDLDDALKTGMLMASERGRTQRVPREQYAVRRKNRRRHSMHRMSIIEAVRGKTRLRWTGQHFSEKGRAKLFPDQDAAVAKARALLSKHRDVLRNYRIQVRT